MSESATSPADELPPPRPGAEGRDLFISAPDGLRLHAREYGPRVGAQLPVVCLPGLARTTADFEPLAEALAADAERPRRVVAIDSRGRGRSDHDSSAANYSLPVELGDVLAVLTALAIGRAVFVGTSRGGILTMLLAAAQPTRIAGVVLNDIGPVLEPQGVMRIKSYVGKLPPPRDFADAADILRRIFGAQFPKLTPQEWLEAARLTWHERNGALALNYDPKLAHTLDAVDLEKPMPALWPQFDALAAVPVLVVRGALSDLLSAETVQQMRARRARLEYIEVADEGHAPRLGAPALIARIAKFAAACDQRRN